MPLQNDESIILAAGKAVGSYRPTRKDKTRWKRTDDMSSVTARSTLDEGVKTVKEIVET